MRRIIKYAQPVELKEWRRQAKKAGVNYSFEGMRDDVLVKKAVQAALLAEQGNLCAYTGIRIDETTSHLEHLKAREHCEADEKTDYKNLVACYPITGKCEFGAFKKDTWPNHNNPAEARLFVSPLFKRCETSFEFEDTGHIKGNNKAAEVTINKLGLDHKELNTRRRLAIANAIRPNGQVLTAEQTQKILSTINRPKDGRLREFSFVLEQALRRHLQSFTA